MDRSELPADLVKYLSHGEPPRTLETRYYDVVTLIPLNSLRVETLPVTPNCAPFAREDPHREDYGSYAVPAVNLVLGDPRSGTDFPAWLLLWLPNECRYGSYDLDHGDVLMFAPDVRWSDIIARPEAFVQSSDGGRGSPVAIEYLRPWPKYPFIREDYELS